MVKQVIVMRTDLKNAKGEKVRSGKLIAQGAHASMSVFFQRFKKVSYSNFPDLPKDKVYYEMEVTPEMAEWIDGKFTKVCLKVDSEQELLDIYNKAHEAGLPCSLIKDAGLTEFGNVPTYTAVAIGPDKCEKIDLVTGHLKLF